MKYSLGVSNYLEEISILSHSVVFLYSLHWSLRKAFLPLLAILWNSAFKLVYLSFSPLLFASLLFTAICKASSDNHFGFLHFFFLGMVLIPATCTMSRSSIHSSSGTLSIRSNPLNLFFTSLHFSAIFKASSDSHFSFCISFSWEWSWSLPLVQGLEPPSIIF